MARLRELVSLAMPGHARLGELVSLADAGSGQTKGVS